MVIYRIDALRKKQKKNIKYIYITKMITKNL